MELTSIRDVSQSFGVSTRTLRYYEEVGLLKSTREADGAFRAYDEAALHQLKQILVLRALRLPLKQIRTILQGGELAASLRLLEQHAQVIGQEVDLLQTILTALDEVTAHLRHTGQLTAPTAPIDDQTARKLVRALSVPIPNIKEAPSMPKLTDVRIVYLPPATVCSIHKMGPSAEAECAALLDTFILDSGLLTRMPGARHYGFNHPNGEKPDGSDHGYETWVTIPDDMDVPSPFVKKTFPGGLYAAHMIPMGAFEEWGWLYDWVKASPDYTPRPGPHEMMDGLLEELLNLPARVGATQAEKDKNVQLDLLFPIQEKTK